MIPTRCTKCKTEKPSSEFRADPKRKSGLSFHCKACQSEYSRSWYFRNWEKRRAQLDAYKAEHPETERAYRQRRWQRIKADPKRLREEMDKNNAYRHANPERIRERDRHRPNSQARLKWKATWERQKLAIENGKTSPICKMYGFALVADGDRWRAARIGMPWEPNERAYALFRYGLGGLNQWFVSPPSLRVPDPNLVERLQKREHCDSGWTRALAGMVARESHA